MDALAVVTNCWPANVWVALSQVQRPGYEQHVGSMLSLRLGMAARPRPRQTKNKNRGEIYKRIP